MYRIYGKDRCRTAAYQRTKDANARCYSLLGHFRKYDIERRYKRSYPRLVLPSVRHTLYHRVYRRSPSLPRFGSPATISHQCEEIKKQLLEKEGRDYPDYLIACVGGGSNAAGTIYHYLDNENVKIVLAEAGGKGVDSGLSAATIQLGKIGIIHGARTLVMQNEDGQIEEPYSISAGLDYPGIGPIHANLSAVGRAQVLAINDNEALDSAFELTRTEGIIPALESAHALGALRKIKFNPDDIVVLTISGRGDKDMDTYINYYHQK